MEQKGTSQRKIRIAANLEPDLIEKIDHERKGRCSRATIVRMALLDRYQKLEHTSREVA
jgi:hypothetical protein